MKTSQHFVIGLLHKFIISVITLIFTLIIAGSSPSKIFALPTCGFSTDPATIMAGAASFTMNFNDIKSQLEILQKEKSNFINGEIFLKFPKKETLLCQDLGDELTSWDGWHQYKLVQKGNLDQLIQKNHISVPYSWEPTRPCNNERFNSGDHIVQIVYRENDSDSLLCQATYTITEEQPDAKIIIKSDNGKRDIDSTWTITISDIKIPKTWGTTQVVTVSLSESNGTNEKIISVPDATVKTISGNWKNNTSSGLPIFGIDPNSTDSTTIQLNPLNKGSYTISLKRIPTSSEIKSQSFEVITQQDSVYVPPQCKTTCIKIDPVLGPTYNCTDTKNLCDYCPSCPNAGIIPPEEIKEIANLEPLCVRIGNGQEVEGSDCMTCVNKAGVWTALGCLSTDWSDLINNYVFKIGIGLAGVTSFLFFLYGCFLILTSSGNPEQLTQAKEIIMSALSGLILIIFSVFLLRIIGVNILGLPGFT